MITENTIKRELALLELKRADLYPSDRASDQAYGAVEALRWVLGQGPRPVHLAETLLTKAVDRLE